MDIGKLIRLYRRGASMSQKDLQENSGVSANTICDIEQNKVSPTVRTMEAIAEGLNMKLVVTFVEK